MPNLGQRAYLLSSLNELNDNDLLIIHHRVGDYFRSRKITIDTFSRTFPFYNRVLEVSAQIASLSASLNTLSSEVDTLSSYVYQQFAEIDAEIVYLSGFIDVNANGISYLSSMIDENSGDIVYVSSQFDQHVTTNNSNIVYLSTQIDAVSADVINKTFVSLVDTPSSLVGHGGDIIKVNSTEDELDFADTLEQWAAVPSGYNAAGTKGQRAYDGTYIYECVSTNVWIKHAVVTNF